MELHTADREENLNLICIGVIIILVTIMQCLYYLDAPGNDLN